MDDENNGFHFDKAFAKLSALKAGAVFMNDAEAKIALTMRLIMSKANEFDFVVWIAPASFLAGDYYQNLIKTTAGEFCRKICFFSIESISNPADKYLRLYNLSDKYRTFCVVDDSLTIKNTEAGRTKRLLAMHRKFKFRLILSSVPLTQGLIDLYSQIKFIDANILRMTETQFSNFFLPFYVDGYYNIMRRWSTPENERLLMKLIQPYIYHCDSKHWDNCLRHHNHYFELTPKEAVSYREEKEKFLDSRCQAAFMEVVQHFQHIYTISKNKVEALFSLVQEIKARKEKVIIYTKYLDEIVFLKESGGFRKGEFVELTGHSNKRKAILSFENDVDIMFCTYRVDRLDLSLRCCDNIVYFSQTFDYKDKVQSLYNLERRNKNHKINIYNFWVKTGLEELIRDNLNRKINVLNNVCRIMSREAALEL